MVYFSAHHTDIGTARPTTTRTLNIPDVSDPRAAPLPIHLHEPSLTADHLGHKTWVAGYLLAKRIPLLKPDVPALQPGATDGDRPLALELGSGTGLVGLTLAHRAPHVELHVTDLPEIIPNLAANVNRNFPQDLEHSPSPQLALVKVFALDWNTCLAKSARSSAPRPCCVLSQTPVPRARPANYDLIVAADVLYGPEHPVLVARVVSRFLKRAAHARFVAQGPMRDREGGSLKSALEMQLVECGLQLVKQGEEIGWEEMGREDGRVVCWWGIWEWRGEV